LQRLAGQAIGAPTSRVRAAERVRAYVPIAMPAATAPHVRDDSLRQAAEQMPRLPHRNEISTSGLAPRLIDRQVPAFGAPERPTPHLITPREVAPREVEIAPRAVPALPAPLLDEVARAGPAPTIVGSIKPAARPPAIAAPGEPTEVHVHIGRIEVTAVQPPPTAPRKREAAPRRGIALSDYLARRRPS
jgi:hypothetical protein